MGWRGACFDLWELMGETKLENKHGIKTDTVYFKMYNH